MRLAGWVLLLIGLTAHAAEEPVQGPASSIGAAAHGCLQGGASLPETGPGWQVLRPDHNRFWGTPALISVLEEHAASIAGKSSFLVGDMSLPRGGRMPTGHASHQTGLDADILFRQTDHPLTAEERDDPDFSPVFDDKGKFVKDRWGAAQVALLRGFAEDKRVERIFVNPVIKRNLCRSQKKGDTAWLHRVRPWWGHAAHFHVRLACPVGDVNCEAGPTIAEGDGCGAELNWWFTAEANSPAEPTPPPSTKIPPRYNANMPLACKEILAGN